MNEKLLYRPAEACETLGIKLTNFWRLVKEGQIETRKLGAATVVTAESLRRFVDGLPSAAAETASII